MKHKGFTVVELLIVIVVIGILVSIIAVSYIFLRDDSNDASIKSAVRLSGDAIQLHEAQTKSRIGAEGIFSQSGGVDALVGQGYLKQGYRSGLTSTNSSNSNHIMRWYDCDSGPNSGGFIVYASLSNPTSEDVDNFTSLRSSCGHGSTEAPTTGSTKYNYAQIF